MGKARDFMRRWKMRYIIALMLIVYLFCLPKQLFDVPFATVVTDRNGELLGARIAADGQWRFPPCENAPEKFAKCLILFEDRYYKYHFGVNPFSVIRALKQNIAAGRTVSGGSTITMQTVRLARGKKRTAGEKIIEMMLATRLECRYSKREILALYASYAPFGGNVVGIDAAAWRYFGHPSDQLSWAEAAVLAVLPNAPSMINPSKNRSALLEKRNKLLQSLYNEHVIDNIDFELALSEELPSEPLPLPQTAPHLVTYYAKNEAGKTVKTSIDRNLQIQSEEILERWHNELIRSDIRNLAALVIDVRTGEAVAYCGNVCFDSGNSANQVDIIRSPRSTGSILKPLLYCAALEEGAILPHTLLPDIPLNINGFTPQNFNMQYDGAVPASKVISRSLNVPSVFLLREYGVPKFYDYLKTAGITTLDKPSSHYGLSLILGGAEATLWDVAFAYCSMARALNEIQNHVGAGYKGAVWQVFDAIKEVNRPEEIDWRYIPSMQTIAWKTGTSYGFRDAWAVGVTSRYVVGVWVGNANGEGKPELVGARTAGPVMFDIFNMLPSSPWFDCPEDEFTEAVVCRRSGHLANRYCDETDTMLILPAGLNTEPCPYHTFINTTADGRFRVFENCMAENGQAVRRSWFVLPPVWEWYYKQHHPEYLPLPPFLQGCGGESQSPMAFIYPQNGNARVYLPRQLDGSEGGVTFELAHSNAKATVFWHLDENYLGSTLDFHKLTVSPPKGKHTITVIDNDGNTLSTAIIVE
ncbi:MAG: penicillin-binding protein 1C [Tannerella sp.]|jgi:penicillin-binding protein 1C|nr:penicillin-binding protein 1C [Tannerella sp.]